jgi:hypothetical protein
MTDESYPKSLHHGIWNLGSLEIECHVLDTEERIIAQQGAAQLFLGPNGQSGNLGISIDRLLSKINELSGVANRPKTSIKQYLTINKIKGLSGVANVFIPPWGGYAYGYKAEDVLSMARAFSYALKEGLLRRDQLHIGRNAFDILDACAEAGLVALIDEATGYQLIRDANDLEIRVNAFLRSNARDWQRLFSDDMWAEYARVYKDKWKRGDKRPPRGAMPSIIKNDIYGYVAGKDVIGVLKEWYATKGSKPKHGDNMHQYFSDKTVRAVIQRMGEVYGVLKSSDNKEQFRYKMNRLNRVPMIQADMFYER